MIIFIILLLSLSISSCQQQQPTDKGNKDNIVVCFDHYHPKPYRTPGGIGHIPMPKVLYTDSTETLTEYTPSADFDTLTLHSPEHFKELGLNYGNFEFTYYPLMQSRATAPNLPILLNRFFMPPTGHWRR